MRRNCPKQAIATREAHEALIERKKLVDEAAKETHKAELESLSAAMKNGEDSGIRVIEHLKSPNFDAVLASVREKLQMAVST
jgi:hypothetical protein